MAHNCLISLSLSINKFRAKTHVILSEIYCTCILWAFSRYLLQFIHSFLHISLLTAVFFPFHPKQCSSNYVECLSLRAVGTRNNERIKGFGWKKHVKLSVYCRKQSTEAFTIFSNIWCSILPRRLPLTVSLLPHATLITPMVMFCTYL